MADVRWVARIVLAIWLVTTIVAMFQWVELWVDSWTTFLIGLAGFLAGPALLVVVTGVWRNRIVRQFASQA
jgi:hypothetical protein